MNYIKGYNGISQNEEVDGQEFVVLSSCRDPELWEQFKLGNKKAFDIIYDKFFDSLCCYGDRICDNKSLVQDVVQDLFIYLWTEKEKLGKTDAIKYYLFCCLRRKLIRTISQEKRRSTTFSALKKESLSFQLSLKMKTIQTSEDEEMHKKLALALNKLTDRQKEAIYLKFYNNLSFQEVASIMEIEVRSVYNLISRTIDVLRGDLKHQELSTLLIILFLPFILKSL